jgi:opacity protein-like surface antigen
MTRLPGLLRRMIRASALLALLCALVVARPARAAGYLDDWHPYQTYWGVGWSVPVPITAMRASYIDNPGWLGGTFDLRIGVVGRLALGVSANWNWFDQVFPFTTVQSGDFTFTGPLYRRLSAFTCLGTAHYYLTRGAVQPYLGVGAGGIWTSTLQQVVNLQQGGSNSGFAFAGEAGILFTVAERLGLYLSGRYQYNLTTLDGVRNPQWVAGQTGIAGAGQAISAESFRLLVYHACLIQAVFSGLLAGYMGEGSLTAGVKHVCILLLIALVAFNTII